VSGPDVSVVVASHAREEGLRTLIDALADQTLPRERWELIVAHTYGPAAARVLDEHELARDGTLRSVPVDPAAARPSIQRNQGVSVARGRLVAFTDDDCRPAPDWLDRLLAAHVANPRAIVQGATRVDPRDEHLWDRVHLRALHIEPPIPNAQTCNVLYERELLDRVGGFDERAITGEDLELAVRAQDAGASLVGAPDAVVYHAMEALSLTEKIRSQHKWQHLAYVVKRHPRLREQFPMGIWWKREHLGAAVALAALAGGTRRPWMLAGLLYYANIERKRHGTSPRAQLRAIWELPPHWVVELAEIGSFVRGSIRYRTILL
jgi:GT2 family glycosyltransferase